MATASHTLNQGKKPRNPPDATSTVGGGLGGASQDSTTTLGSADSRNIESSSGKRSKNVSQYVKLFSSTNSDHGPRASQLKGSVVANQLSRSTHTSKATLPFPVVSKQPDKFITKFGTSTKEAVSPPASFSRVPNSVTTESSSKATTSVDSKSSVHQMRKRFNATTGTSMSGKAAAFESTQKTKFVPKIGSIKNSDLSKSTATETAVEDTVDQHGNGDDFTEQTISDDERVVEEAMTDEFFEEEIIDEEVIEEEYTETSYLEESIRDESISKLEIATEKKGAISKHDICPDQTPVTNSAISTRERSSKHPSDRVTGVIAEGVTESQPRPSPPKIVVGQTSFFGTQRRSGANLAQSSHSTKSLEPEVLRSPIQEGDGLVTASCHSPRTRSRPGISRNKSGPDAFETIGAPPATPPITVSRKMRQLVKSLEFSNMLSKDDTIKLFDELLMLIKGDRTKQAEFGVGKGISGFLKVLTKHQEHLSVLECAFLVIAELAEIDTNRDALALNGCIEFVLIEMLRHEKGLILQERGCYALASLAKTQKYQEWIVASNGIEVIITTQSGFKSNIKIQTACLRAIHNLARDNKENGFSIAAKGGVRSLMEIIKWPEHSKNQDFQLEACATMATLARTNDSNRGTIAAGGGIEVTLKAMKAFPQNADLQAVGFDTLYCLSVGHAQNCASIVAKRGDGLLIQNMKTFENNLHLQETGMVFARLLTENNAKEFVAVGGIKVVLVAMRHFEESHIIQDEGCSTLLNMAMQPESKDPICSSGGIGIIVMAMKKLSTSALVQKNGCKALESLATSDQNKKSVAAGGGINAIMAAMKTHREVPALQGLAVSALRKLASIGRNRNIMNENNCIETIDQALERNPTNTYLQQNGVPLLELLDPSRKKEGIN